MDIRVALTTDMEKEFKAEAARAERAVTGAIRRAGSGLKDDLRGQTQAAGLGARLPRTWRSDAYPKSGASLSAAAMVYSKAPLLARVFSEGATIRSKNGVFLAVPTDAAPKRGVGDKRISPRTFPEHTLGKLRLVYRPGRPSLLVVDSVRVGRTGTVRRAKSDRTKRGAYRKGVTTVVMFLLLPQVRIRKRIDLEGASRRWGDRVPGLIADEFRKLDAQAGLR